MTARRPAPLAVPLLEGNEKNDRAAEGLTLAEALERHSERLVLISPSTREMAERGRKICLKYGRSLVEFSPILVW
ncbi:MAG: hypothetical protein EBY32_02795, partial [Proteobacteria bacterium]|nr:hypothetical protein [Pseudomonadota bacterium]